MAAAAIKDPDSERRTLAAVAFLDVVDFTALMAEQERKTFTMWMSLLDEVIYPAIAEHAGTCVKSTGDGALVRFGSAIDAVEWADRVQRVSQDREETAGEPRIELRIAVHVGEVIVSDSNDIFGESVNFAARLLEHAGPGQVILSEVAYNLVRVSAGARAKHLGLYKLKSYEQPARLYVLEPARLSVRRLAANLGSLPSIAVLPLASLGVGAQDDYFAEGVVEDVIVSLSGLGDLLVVSHASTMSFRGFAVDGREVGRALGVRYVLTGTLRRSPQQIRVGWELCDADDGVTLWSEVMQCAPGELFDMQDRIVTKIVSGLAPKVRAVELRRAMRKRPERFTAYDHMLRGLHLLRELDTENPFQALRSLEAAMEEDAFFAMPFAWAAWAHVLFVGQAVAPDPGAAIQRAGMLAARAIELDGVNSLALAIFGHVKSYLFHQYDIGLGYLDRALQAGPSNPLAWTFSAASLAYTGQSEQAVEHGQHALRLSPLDQNIFFLHSNLCLANYAHGDYAAAVRWGRLCEQENPRFSAGYRLLSASLAANGELGEARVVAAKMLTIEPQFSLEEYSRTRQPFRDPGVGGLFVDRLRQAGLPG